MRGFRQQHTNPENYRSIAVDNLLDKRRKKKFYLNMKQSVRGQGKKIQNISPIKTIKHVEQKLVESIIMILE